MLSDIPIQSLEIVFKKGDGGFTPLLSLCDAQNIVFLTTMHCEIDMIDYWSALSLGVGEPVVSKIRIYTTLGYGPFSQ